MASNPFDLCSHQVWISPLRLLVQTLMLLPPELPKLSSSPVPQGFHKVALDLCNKLEHRLAVEGASFLKEPFQDVVFLLAFVTPPAYLGRELSNRAGIYYEQRKPAPGPTCQDAMCNHALGGLDQVFYRCPKVCSYSQAHELSTIIDKSSAIPQCDSGLYCCLGPLLALCLTFCNCVVA